MAHTTCDGAAPGDRIDQVGFQRTGMAENVAMHGNCGTTPQVSALSFSLSFAVGLLLHGVTQWPLACMWHPAAQ